MRLYLSSDTYIDTAAPIDLSLPLESSAQNPRAWYVDPPRFEPVRANGFIGSVAEGGNVNFRDVYFNPHGHGTHTECLGHITQEVHCLPDCVQKTFFTAYVWTVQPLQEGDDFIVRAEQLTPFISKIQQCEALVIRTLPNQREKRQKNYSATNPPYLSTDLIPVLNELGVDHLLLDLPSVDREEDGGVLAFHHAFWQVPEQPQYHKTITELVFVPNEVEDGTYLLNLQFAHFMNDASPSRPLLFRIQQVH